MLINKLSVEIIAEVAKELASSDELRCGLVIIRVISTEFPLTLV